MGIRGCTSGEWCIVSMYLFTLWQSVHLGSQSGNQLSPSPLVCGHMSTPVNCFDRQAKTVEGTNESLRIAPGGRVEQVTWKTMSRTAGAEMLWNAENTDRSQKTSMTILNPEREN